MKQLLFFLIIISTRDFFVRKNLKTHRNGFYFLVFKIKQIKYDFINFFVSKRTFVFSNYSRHNHSDYYK